MMDDVDSFASMFGGPPGTAQRESRVARAQKEKRTQLTEKQRKRKPTRTTQINFRCTPAFKDMAEGLKEHLDCSVADVMEKALELLAQQTGYKGGE